MQRLTIEPALWQLLVESCRFGVTVAAMEWPFRKGDGRPAWDHARAEELIGSTVVVRLTYNEPSGPQVQQFHGTIMSACPNEGITLRLEGSRLGQFYTLPPALEALFPAKPGSYRLRETGEVVTDPDYTTTWDRTSPSN